MACSKGTYIRVLAEDMGRVLGCGAFMQALRRTRIGGFDIGQAVTLEQLDGLDLEARDARLLPPDCLLDGIAKNNAGSGKRPLFSARAGDLDAEAGA